MTQFTVFTDISERPWWQAALAVRRALDARDQASKLHTAARVLAGALVQAGYPDIEAATLCTLREAVLATPVRHITKQTEALIALDIAELLKPARAELAGQLQQQGITAVPLANLTVLAPSWLPAWRAAMQSGAAAVTEKYLAQLRTHGAGPSAMHAALKWRGGQLVPITRVHGASFASLHGLDEQLATLQSNTLALLAGQPTHNVLLYGPRGSGKSTALRALLPAYAAEGLRLIELTLGDLGGLEHLFDQLAESPLKFVVFIDDLAFDDGDDGYRPLKSVLDGGLTEQPANVAIYATSNRRHIVRESIKNRPDPLDDDLHKFDSEHEQLAFADRFGTTITFPGATQRRYLAIVDALAKQQGIVAERLHERAILFADWQNGYSGRTAKQFIERLQQE